MRTAEVNKLAALSTLSLEIWMQEVLASIIFLVPVWFLVIPAWLKSATSGDLFWGGYGHRLVIAASYLYSHFTSRSLLDIVCRNCKVLWTCGMPHTGVEGGWVCGCCLLGVVCCCLTSQQHASVSQGQICWHNHHVGLKICTQDKCIHTWRNISLNFGTGWCMDNSELVSSSLETLQSPPGSTFLCQIE